MSKVAIGFKMVGNSHGLHVGISIKNAISNYDSNIHGLKGTFLNYADDQRIFIDSASK